RTALRRATDHHAVGTCVLEHIARLLRCGDVAVGDHRQTSGAFHFTNGVVLGISAVTACSRATVDCNQLNPRFLYDARNVKRVLVARVPPGTKLQHHEHLNLPDHRSQYAPHWRLISHLRRACNDVPDLLGRATHVDTDDLRALIDDVARSIRHHL